MDNFIEKYFDLTETGVEYTIKQHLANGWFVSSQGLTLLIMRKYI